MECFRIINKISHNHIKSERQVNTECLKGK